MTTEDNADNIDQIIVNIRATTENLKELTDSLKANPSLLIREAPEGPKTRPKVRQIIHGG